MLIKQPYVLALVTYNANYKVPVGVFPHEVDILKVRFGDERVVVLSDLPPVAEGEFETSDEYARLLESHPGTEDSPNPVRDVFRNLEEFEAAFAPPTKAK